MTFNLFLLFSLKNNTHCDTRPSYAEETRVGWKGDNNIVMRSESLVFVQTGHTQVQLEADQSQAEGDHRILKIKS